MTVPQPDWEQTLERVPHRGLRKDDIVYERVRHGQSNGHSKWNKARVVDSNHAVVRVRFEEAGREAMMRYSDLFWEPAPPVTKSRTVVQPLEREPLSEPQQPRQLGTSDDEYRAWVAMGQDMLASMDRQRTSTETELRDVASQIDAIDLNARRRIESLEAELVEAKREHQNDRAFFAVRQEQLTTKLASLNDRRQAMAALMGEP